MSANTGVAFQEYLANFPSGKNRDKAQQELAWSKAEANNTIQAFNDYLQKYPQGAHLGDASKKIEDLKRADDRTKESQRFQEARNSKDDAVLQAYLSEYPSGDHYDQILGHLDDVYWEKTNKNDKSSLQAYIGRTPQGRHTGEARDAIARLTEAAVSAKPPKVLVDPKAEVLKSVDRYVKAYNDTNVEELKQIWPGMDKTQVSSMHDFFRTARNVRSSYTLLEEPKISVADATVTIIQVTTFVLEGQQKRQSSTLTLKLKPVPGTSGGWEISSLSGD